MAYLVHSFMENKRKETLYERVMDVLIFPENNKISSPFLSNKQGHKLTQSGDLLKFYKLMQIVNLNVTINEPFVQQEPIPSFNKLQPLGVSSPLGCSPPAAVMAPTSQTSTPPGLDEHWSSHRQIPTLIVEDASVESGPGLDYGEIISVCEHSGFDMKISIDASEKNINYDFLPQRQSSTSEEAQLRKGFNSYIPSKDFL